MTAPILVVDDDPGVLEVVRFALEKAGFAVAEASDGREAVDRARALSPRLVVLDVNMPELSGTDVCRILRAESDVPIVFLSSADDEIDRVLGLEMGGDDYITKPFSTRELVARVKAVLRRLERVAKVDAPASERVLTHGALRLDLDRCEARWGDTAVVLTATELGLVRTLLGHPGRVYSRDELMRGAYDEFTVVSDRTIDSHIRRVRAKFAAAGGDVVETVHGMGYRIAEARVSR